MNNLSKYILEKLHLNKDNKNLDTFDSQEANEKVLKSALDGVYDFLLKVPNLEKDDFDIKLNNRNEICVHFYIGDKQWYKQLEDKFYNDGFGRSDWFSEIFVTNYGLRIRPSFYISKFDFDKKVFRHRK